MSENKIAKVPIASHGLHKHSYNYPWLSSMNFGDVMPCYYNPIRKGERDNPKAGMYSQLMPIAHNAFATGRFNFKAIFVPYKFVWRLWYYFDQQLEYFSNGTSYRPSRYPFVEDHYLSAAFLDLYGTEDGDQSDYDVVFNDPTNTVLQDAEYYHINDNGRRVLRILGALGCMPSFIKGNNEPINILPLMCYIKAFSDYYFPNNYVGGSVWSQISVFFETDETVFNFKAQQLLQALDQCSLNYYENSVFDLAWDNPVTPNVASTSPVVRISDVTDPEGDFGSNVNNEEIAIGTPVANVEPGGFTQYIVNALKSVSLWAKRRQLSGARLLDKFLVSRGISLSNDSARISYLVGERNIEIEVSGVENNTDTNLGELAGRGIASSGKDPLSFECKPDDDGILFVIVSPIPDANFPVTRDGFTCRQDFLDNYTAEYDKLGAAPISKRVVFNSPNGYFNSILAPSQAVFGFVNRYWDEVQEKPRLLGDFILKSRGATELQAYHTFRIFGPPFLSPPIDVTHSLDFIRMSDSKQFQRLFYSSQQENLMLFLRWFGDQFKEKLPLGDSYEWDDDEMNRRVSVVVGGSQK